MKIKYLVNQIRAISGYQEKTSSKVNSNKVLINDNMVFRAINEAQRFMYTSVLPHALNVPLNIDFNTDILGADLLRIKLSSYNEGSRIVKSSNTTTMEERLNIPTKQKTCSIIGINQSESKYSCFGNGLTIVYSQDDYLRGSKIGIVGQVTISRFKSATFECDTLSTFKTIFKVKDKTGKIIDSYSITTDSNVYDFYMNFVRISVNYKTGLIVCSYEGSDIDEYTIEISTMSQPANVLYFNKGQLRISNRNIINNLRDISIRVAPYAIYDRSQEICNIYDEDLIELLSYRSAVEVQRFNRSVDQNLIDIVSNKQSDYSDRERSKDIEQINDLIYPTTGFYF